MAATNRSCPVSTPRLKKSKEIGICPAGMPISLKAPAKPKPCRSPNAKATIQGARAVMPGFPARALRISTARNAIESAMMASTGFDGTRTRPKVAAANVMLWASVNERVAWSIVRASSELAEGCGDEDEPEHEEEVVVSEQDVLDAEREVGGCHARTARGHRNRGGWSSRREPLVP